VDKEGVLYIADGVTLRTVDQRGRIATVVGSQAISTSWRPLLCHQNTPASQVHCVPCLTTPSCKKRGTCVTFLRDSKMSVDQSCLSLFS